MRIIASLLVAALMSLGFVSSSSSKSATAAPKSECCGTGAACCYPGSPCCE